MSAAPRCGGLLLLALTLALPLLKAAAQPQAPSAACAAPADLLQSETTLPGLAPILAGHGSLTVVAIGGASTLGAAAGDPDRAFPHRLQEILRRRFPTLSVTVLNKAIPHQSAEEMVARFATDVLPFQPDLVLWETGTTDAVRGVDLDTFAMTLQDGVDQLRRRHVAVLLIDLQYARVTESVIEFEPYLDALHQFADANDVALFRRFEIMQLWSENGAFDLHDVPKAARAAQAAQLYGCLAERLADVIVGASR
jgi:hypothetical protein